MSPYELGINIHNAAALISGSSWDSRQWFCPGFVQTLLTDDPETWSSSVEMPVTACCKSRRAQCVSLKITVYRVWDNWLLSSAFPFRLNSGDVISCICRELYFRGLVSSPLGHDPSTGELGCQRVDWWSLLFPGDEEGNRSQGVQRNNSVLWFTAYDLHWNVIKYVSLLSGKNKGRGRQVH